MYKVQTVNELTVDRLLETPYSQLPSHPTMPFVISGDVAHAALDLVART